jgi:hypothetical protein
MSILNGAALPFFPPRWEQQVDRDYLRRGCNWYKEEGKIPCGYGERAKFNHGGYSFFK